MAGNHYQQHFLYHHHRCYHHHHHYQSINNKNDDYYHVLGAFLKINGMKPTDIGLRPDLTVRTCPVEIHTCLSSSNDPSDIGKC